MSRRRVDEIEVLNQFPWPPATAVVLMILFGGWAGAFAVVGLGLCVVLFCRWHG